MIRSFGGQSDRLLGTQAFKKIADEARCSKFLVAQFGVTVQISSQLHKLS